MELCAGYIGAHGGGAFGKLSEQPFSKENPPVRILAAGRPVESWQMENNSAGDLPESPVAVDAAPETVELVPYACTKLRISLFPWL